MSNSPEIEKLQQYRDEVVREIQVRTERVRNLDQKLELQERKLELRGAQRGGVVGTSDQLQAYEAYRKRIARVFGELKKSRVEAVADLARAQERLTIVDEELEAAADGNQASEE